MNFWHRVGNISQAIISFFIYSVVQLLYIEPKSQVVTWGRGIVLDLITIAAFMFIFWLYTRQLQTCNSWEFNEPPHWRISKIGIAIVAAVVMIVGQVVIIHFIGGGVSQNQQELEAVQRHSNQLMKVMVVIVAPFCEEVIFRGMFFNSFFTTDNPRNKWLGIICCGFLFGYVHDPMLSKFVFIYWFMGCILAWVYLKTRDLRYSMIVHALNNLTAVL